MNGGLVKPIDINPYKSLNRKMMLSISIVMLVVGAVLFYLYMVLDKDYLGIMAIILLVSASILFVLYQLNEYKLGESPKNRFLKFGMRHTFLCTSITVLICIIAAAIITGEYLIALLLAPLWIFACVAALGITWLIVKNL
jgi:hypothetical protein